MSYTSIEFQPSGKGTNSSSSHTEHPAHYDPAGPWSKSTSHAANATPTPRPTQPRATTSPISSAATPTTLHSAIVTHAGGHNGTVTRHTTASSSTAPASCIVPHIYLTQPASSHGRIQSISQIQAWPSSDLSTSSPLHRAYATMYRTPYGTRSRYDAMLPASPRLRSLPTVTTPARVLAAPPGNDKKQSKWRTTPLSSKQRDVSFFLFSATTYMRPAHGSRHCPAHYSHRTPPHVMA